MRIGLDAMGGDFAPEATIGGALLAKEALSDNDHIVLIGQEDVIRSELEKQNNSLADFEIEHAPDIINMGERPIRAYSQKPNSSIGVGFRMLKSREIDTFASAGNSGATLVGAMYSINSIKGVIRPCTSALIPQEKGGVSIILDIGTNPDIKPDVMYQFAILGSIYAKHVLNIREPRVGLLNIGEEEEKGNLLTHSSYQLMKDSKDFFFHGNVEGRDLFKGKVDVIVTDGFTGNTLIKQIEAFYRLMQKRDLLDDFFTRLNYENYGGTPILGINGSVVIGHGISSKIAIKNMLLLSAEIHRARLSQKIKRALNKYLQKSR